MNEEMPCKVLITLISQIEYIITRNQKRPDGRPIRGNMHDTMNSR